MSMHSHNGRPHLIISLTSALAIVALVIITIQTYSTYFADNVDNNDNDSNHDGRNNNDRRQLRPCGNERDNPAWHPTYSVPWNEGYCTFTIDCDSPVSFCLILFLCMWFDVLSIAAYCVLYHAVVRAKSTHSKHTNSILNVSIKTKTHTDIHSILSLYILRAIRHN